MCGLASTYIYDPYANQNSIFKLIYSIIGNELVNFDIKVN